MPAFFYNTAMKLRAMKSLRQLIPFRDVTEPRAAASIALNRNKQAADAAPLLCLRCSSTNCLLPSAHDREREFAWRLPCRATPGYGEAVGKAVMHAAAEPDAGD